MHPLVLVNGVPNKHISALDRGFMYGHGVYETGIIHNGQLLLIKEHLDRLSHGCDALGIPNSAELLTKEITKFIKNINLAVLRISISIGEGGRGYLSPVDPKPTRVLSVHDFPDYYFGLQKSGITLGVSNVRLSQQGLLAGVKHANRLEQILARLEWHSDWNEALMLDQDNCVIEATQSNVFILNQSRLQTPELTHSGVAGIMRDQVISIAKQLGLTVQVMPLSLQEVTNAQAIFLTNSVAGLLPVVRLVVDQHNFQFNDSSLAQQLIKKLQSNAAIPTF